MNAAIIYYFLLVGYDLFVSEVFPRKVRGPLKWGAGNYIILDQAAS